jgi:hypothetical protein
MYATTATLQEHHQKEVQDTLPYDKDSTLASQSRIEGKPVQWVTERFKGRHLLRILWNPTR